MNKKQERLTGEAAAKFLRGRGYVVWLKKKYHLTNAQIARMSGLKTSQVTNLLGKSPSPLIAKRQKELDMIVEGLHLSPEWVYKGAQ